MRRESRSYPRMHARRLLLAVLLLAGCGGDGGASGGGGGRGGTQGATGGAGTPGTGGASGTSSGLAGIYKVTSLTRLDPCTGPGEPVAGPYAEPYFQVVDMALANGLYLDVLVCDDAQPTSCDSKDPLLFQGALVGPDEWAAGTTQEEKSAGSCTHAWSGARLKRTPAGVVLQSEYRAEERPEAACTGTISDADAAKGPSLPCLSIEAYTGTRL
jgi:hypothetical protein